MSVRYTQSALLIVGVIIYVSWYPSTLVTLIFQTPGGGGHFSQSFKPSRLAQVDNAYPMSSSPSVNIGPIWYVKCSLLP